MATSAPFTSQHGTGAPNSADAVKTFVNANIQITPATDTNAVNTNHVLTITINAVGGTIDAGPHTATASHRLRPGQLRRRCEHLHLHRRRGHRDLHRDDHLGHRRDHGRLGHVRHPGQRPTITRTTNTAVNTAAGGSGNASKIWVNANIQITPATATNAVGTNHVLTITVNAIQRHDRRRPAHCHRSIVSGPGSFVGPATPAPTPAARPPPPAR